MQQQIKQYLLLRPFKDQKYATAVRKQLKNLSAKIGGVELLPAFTSSKIENQLKHRETKPQLVNQQCVVYDYKCDLYISYSRLNKTTKRFHFFRSGTLVKTMI